METMNHKLPPRFWPPLLLAFLPLVLAGWALWAMPKSDRGMELVFKEYLFLALAALFAALAVKAAWLWLGAVTLQIRERLLLVLPALVLVWSATKGMDQFPGYDGSTLVLVGWIERLGLRLYRDIPCTMPPLFVLGPAYAFRIFGLHWWAIVLLTGLFTLGTFFWLARQLEIAGFAKLWSALIAFTVEMATMGLAGFWWYNPLTGVIVFLVLASALACLQCPSLRCPWISLSAALMLLLLAKPNAWPAGACALVLLCGSRQSRIRMLMAGAGGMIAALLLCRINGINFLRVLHAYSQVAGSRGNPFSLLAFASEVPLEGEFQLGATAVLGAAFLALLLRNCDELLLYWRQYASCVAVGLTSLWIAFTNLEMKVMDLAPLVAVCVVIAYRPWSRKCLARSGRFVIVPLLAVSLLASGYWTATRLRVRLAGEGKFYENSGGYVIKEGFFSGLSTGGNLVRVVRQIREVLQANPAQSVYFGPRIEFSYAAFGRKPAKGLPLFWHSGTAYPEAELPKLVGAFAARHFQLLIFLHDDYTRMPVEILQGISRNYQPVSGYDQLDVYISK